MQSYQRPIHQIMQQSIVLVLSYRVVSREKDLFLTDSMVCKKMIEEGDHSVRALVEKICLINQVVYLARDTLTAHTKQLGTTRRLEINRTNLLILKRLMELLSKIPRIMHWERTRVRLYPTHPLFDVDLGVVLLGNFDALPIVIPFPSGMFNVCESFTIYGNLLRFSLFSQVGIELIYPLFEIFTPHAQVTARLTKAYV